MPRAISSGANTPFFMQWVILTLALLTLAGALGFLGYREYADVAALQGDRLLVPVRVIAANLDRQLESVHQALLGVREDLPAWGRDGDWASASRRLKVFSDAMPGVRTMVVGDARGVVLASDRAGLIGQDISPREYFQTVQREPDPARVYLSPPYKSMLGVHVINMVMMVPGPAGEFAGVVVASLDPDFFSALLSPVRYAPDMWLAIAHGDGRQFLMSPERPGMEGMNLAVPGSFFSRHMQSGRKESLLVGMAHATGEERMMAMRTVSPEAVPLDKPLVLAVGRELGAMYAAWRRDMAMQGGLLAFLALAAVAGLGLHQRRQRQHLLQAEAVQAALRESELWMRSTFHALDAAMFITKPDWRLVNCNEAAVAMFGHAPEELRGRSTALLHIDAGRFHEFAERVRERFARGEMARFEFEARRADGQVFPSEQTVCLLNSDQGEPLGILNIVRDLTQSKRDQESLRQKTEELERYFTNSLDLLCIADLDGHFRRLNPEWEKTLGYSLEELQGRRFLDFVHPEDVEATQAAVGELSAGKEVLNFVNRYRRKDGSYRWIEWLSFPVGELIYANARDITDRRRGEEALRESEERFRVLSEESPLGISLIDRDGRYEYLNPAFIKMFGYTLEDIPTGRDWFRLAFPDPGHRRQIEDAWREDLRDIPAGESRPRTFDVRCKDGEVKTILFLPVTISSGGQFVLYVDISERLRAEQALKESEGRYRDLFDSISDFICTHDLEGRLLTINETASQAAGVKAREMVGRNLREFVPPQFQEAFDREYLPAIRAKGYSEGVTKFLARDGQARYLEYRNRLVREPGQQPLVIASARDVTQRIMAERELRRLEEQLLRSQKIEAVGVLAGGIAHDFNNVLQAISGYAQLLSAEDGLSPLGRERLESIGRSIERAARMINQLMTLAHKVETRRERVDLNQEVRQTVAILEHTLPRMISIRTDLEDQLKAISGDPGQVEQIMLNLATNAGHAMPQGGELSFRTRNAKITAEEPGAAPGLSPGEYAVLEVADTGLGMDDQTMSHIFEPFFTTKALGEGTGLGLSTVYGIVTNHGGHIVCQSGPNQGTTFTIYFPVAAAADREQPGEAGPSPGDVAGSETILLVDDEPSILESCREALEGFGYRVLSASRGEEALALYLRDPQAVDLVILDLNMPGMGGLDCMKAMLAAQRRARIMVATGYADPGIKEAIDTLGGVGLVAKPYRFTDLLTRVREALDAS